MIMFSLVFPARYLAFMACDIRLHRGRSAGGVCAAGQRSLAAVQKFENTLTSKFGASGTGCCNVRVTNFRPTKTYPATGNLNVDNFRIAGLVSRPRGKAGAITRLPILPLSASVQGVQHPL